MASYTRMYQFGITPWERYATAAARAKSQGVNGLSYVV